MERVYLYTSPAPLEGATRDLSGGGPAASYPEGHNTSASAGEIGMTPRRQRRMMHR